MKQDIHRNTKCSPDYISGVDEMKEYIQLLRPHLWYRNVLCFIALVGSGALLDFYNYPTLLLRFVALCLASSSGYVFNDILDYEHDKTNPEKANRPIASGAIPLKRAFWIGVFLAASTLGLSISLRTAFPAVLLINNILYSVYFRNIGFLDIVSLSCNYLFRTLEGYSALNLSPDPYLLLSIFFFAMLMSLGKRIGEMKLLEGNVTKHRRSLLGISFSSLITLSAIYGALFLVFTCLFLANRISMCTIPLIVFLTSRYISYLESSPAKVRDPNSLLKDKVFLTAFAIGLAIILVDFTFNIKLW